MILNKKIQDALIKAAIDTRIMCESLSHSNHSQYVNHRRGWFVTKVHHELCQIQTPKVLTQILSDKNFWTDILKFYRPYYRTVVKDSSPPFSEINLIMLEKEINNLHELYESINEEKMSIERMGFIVNDSGNKIHEAISINKNADKLVTDLLKLVEDLNG